MSEVYILNYNTEMIYHFSIDLSDYPDKENDIVETEIKNKGFNLDEVSYMITDNELIIEEV
jgi:hypothetical protein